MQPAFVPTDPLQALLLWVHNMLCTLVSGAPCMMPM